MGARRAVHKYFDRCQARCVGEEVDGVLNDPCSVEGVISGIENVFGGAALTMDVWLYLREDSVYGV